MKCLVQARAVWLKDGGREAQLDITPVIVRWVWLWA